jgi:hypothetical protein
VSFFAMPSPSPPFSSPLRRAEAHPTAEPVLLPARVAWQPLPTPRAYRALSYWEERSGRAVRRTTVERTVRVTAAAQPTAWAVVLEADPPVLHAPDPTALERALLLLAGVYQRLALHLTPAGEVRGLLNHADVQRAWPAIRQAVVDRTGGEDPVTRVLLEAGDAGVAAPDRLLASLRHDYFYDALLGGNYQHYFEHGLRFSQPRRFCGFFDGADLWCHDHLTLAAPAAPGRVALRSRGGLDAARTDLPAVRRGMADARRLGGPPAGPNAPAQPAAPDPADVHAAFAADYDLDATGWPVAVEWSVRCWVPGVYSKEYALRLTLLP